MIEDLLSEIEKIQNSTSLKKINLSDNERFIFNKAYNLLSRREYSTLELKRKLQHRLPDHAELIPPVLSKLEKSGYLSNERYKKMIITKLLKRGISNQNIISELKSHQIECHTDEIDIISSDLGLNKDEQIKKLIRKKIRSIEKKPIQKQKEALIRHLIGKGYLYEDIKKHIGQTFSEIF